MKNVQTFNEFLNEANRIVDDPRIKKEADKLFIERYPKVKPYDIQDIDFDGNDDIIDLIKIVKKRGEATDEEMMRTDYDYAVLKAMQKFGMIESSLNSLTGVKTIIQDEIKKFDNKYNVEDITDVKTNPKGDYRIYINGKDLGANI